MSDTPNVIVGGGAGLATEPLPVPNDRPYIQDLILKDLLLGKHADPADGDARVARDIQKRKEFGIRKYKTGLQAFNGRNPVVDAYQELLDAVIYLRQGIEEARERDNQHLLGELQFEYEVVLVSAKTLAVLVPADA